MLGIVINLLISNKTLIQSIIVLIDDIDFYTNDTSFNDEIQLI